MKNLYTQTNIVLLLTVYVLAMLVSACGGGNSLNFIALAESQNSSFIFDSNNNVAISNGDNTYQQLPTTGLYPTDTIYATTCGMSACVTAGALGMLKVSSNLSDWTTVTPSSSQSLKALKGKALTQYSFNDASISYSNQAIAVGTGGVIADFNAQTGAGLTVTLAGTSDLYAILESQNETTATTYARNAYFAVGANGAIETSVDGLGKVWTPLTSKTTQNLYALTQSDTTIPPSASNPIVVVGSGGTILTSFDGVTWNPSVSGTTNTLLTIEYSNNVFVAAGFNGTIITSPDGVHWTPANTSAVTNITQYNIRDIVSQNNGFLAHGVDKNVVHPTADIDEQIFMSNDGGKTWGNTTATGSAVTASKHTTSKSISGGVFRDAGIFGNIFNKIANFCKENWKPIVAVTAGIAVGTVQAVFNKDISAPVKAIVTSIAGPQNATVMSTVAGVTQTVASGVLKLTEAAAVVAAAAILVIPNTNVVRARLNWMRTKHYFDKTDYILG